MKQKRKAPAGGRNEGFALAMLGKGGNLTHGDRRTKRQRTRGAQKRAALRDQA